MKKYKCSKINGWCEYAGNKYYNYGFVKGTAEYCRKVKRWVVNLEECPLDKDLAAVERHFESNKNTQIKGIDNQK